MSSVGTAIRNARKARHWSAGKLADRASQLPGAPSISELQVRALEKGRNTFKVDDPAEPLPWVMKALGMSIEAVAVGLGLER